MAIWVSIHIYFLFHIFVYLFIYLPNKLYIIIILIIMLGVTNLILSPQLPPLFAQSLGKPEERNRDQQQQQPYDDEATPPGTHLEVGVEVEVTGKVRDDDYDDGAKPIGGRRGSDSGFCYRT